MKFEKIEFRDVMPPELTDQEKRKIDRVISYLTDVFFSLANQYRAKQEYEKAVDIIAFANQLRAMNYHQKQMMIFEIVETLEKSLQK